MLAKLAGRNIVEDNDIPTDGRGLLIHDRRSIAIILDPYVEAIFTFQMLLVQGASAAVAGCTALCEI